MKHDAATEDPASVPTVQLEEPSGASCERIQPAIPKATMHKVLTILAALAIGAAAIHHHDAVIVASALQSEDMDITRNVEQADALLSAYERSTTPAQKQAIAESIPRDANGREETRPR